MFRYIYFLAFALCFFTSCSSIYMPNVPATPMFKNKGEGYIAANVNTKGNISASAGVAVTKNLSIIANGSTINKGETSTNHYNQKLVEGALGYYTKIGKNKLQVFEVFGGYGIGKVRDVDQRASVYGYEEVESNVMDFDKIFLQVNYSSTKKNKINLFGEKRELNYGTAIRVSRLKMREFLINDVAAQKEENLFIEPIFFTRLQLVDGLQLQYTTGFNIGMINNDYLKAGNSLFSLGITYTFGKK